MPAKTIQNCLDKRENVERIMNLFTAKLWKFNCKCVPSALLISITTRWNGRNGPPGPKSWAKMNSRDKHGAVCRRARQNTPFPTLGLKAKPKAIGRGQGMVNVCCRVFFTCYRAAHFIAGLSDDLGAIFEEDRERTACSEEYGFSLCLWPLSTLFLFCVL